MYGDGSKPTQRKDGMWVARFEAGYTAQGTRRRKVVSAKTEAECKRRLRDALRQYRVAGSTSLDPKMNVKRWSQTWLDQQQTRLRPRVYQNHKGTIDKWVTPTIGHRLLHELTPSDIRKVAKTVLDAGRTPTTARNTSTTLLTMLKAAKREGYLIPEPVFLTEKPAIGESTRTSLTIGQAAVILLNAGNPAGWETFSDPTPRHPDGGIVAGRNRTSEQRDAVNEYRRWENRRTHALNTPAVRWQIGMLQALRQGETLGLQWDTGIDFRNHRINIEQELTYLAGDYQIPAHQWHQHLEAGFYLMRPKTAKGRRSIPMIGSVETALHEWREKSPENPYNLVFPKPDSSPQHPKLDRLAWEGIQQAAGVRKPDGSFFLIHEMRHTTVSLLLAAGVDPSLIIEIVGHSTFASSQPYIHRLKEDTRARDALEKIASLLELEN